MTVRRAIGPSNRHEHFHSPRFPWHFLFWTQPTLLSAAMTTAIDCYDDDIFAQVRVDNGFATPRNDGDYYAYDG